MNLVVVRSLVFKWNWVLRSEGCLLLASCRGYVSSVHGYDDVVYPKVPGMSR